MYACRVPLHHVFGNFKTSFYFTVRINDIEAKGVTKVSNIEAKYASLKVEVKMSSMDTLLAADFWPTGVCVRRFYQSRNTVIPSHDESIEIITNSCNLLHYN